MKPNNEVELIRKAVSRKVGLMKCPLTGELLNDVTIWETILLKMLREAKKGKEDSIKMLIKEGFSLELINTITSLKDLRTTIRLMPYIPPLC